MLFDISLNANSDAIMSYVPGKLGRRDTKENANIPSKTKIVRIDD